jgi:bile acid:Na+ symporter, BASS family
VIQIKAVGIVQKILLSFSVMVALGIIFGFISGGFPQFNSEIATIALFIAMTFSLQQISIRKTVQQASKHVMLLAFIVHFILLSGIILLCGSFFSSPLWEGFVVMAAVPPAVAVVPITKVLRGNVQQTIVSLSFLFLIALVLTPVILLIFLGEKVAFWRMVETVVEFIVFPLLLSRLLRKVSLSSKQNSMIVNVCFFIVMFAIVGLNRMALVQDIWLLAILTLVIMIRTIGTALLVFVIGEKKKKDRGIIIPLALFASFKNDGLGLLIAASILPPLASVPFIIAIIFEMVIAGSLEYIVSKNPLLEK